MHNSFNIDQEMQRDNLQPTQSEFEFKVKQQAQNFYSELFDLTARYAGSNLGDMERNGIGTVCETLMSAIAKLELLKQSL